MKRIIGFLVCLVLSAGALSAQEQDFFTQQFDSVSTWRERIGIVRNAAADSSAPAEFYAHALERLILEYPNVAGATDTRITDELAILLAQKLGEAEYTEAGLNLWRTVDIFSNSLVKAEALHSLGKIKAVDYLPQVIQILTDINTDATTDPRNREQVAFGAILALENYADPSGYLPVFFVTTGWYSARIKNQAHSSLPKIMDDPSESLIGIIKSSSYDYAVKYGALQILEESQVTPEKKAAGAVAALTEAWTTYSNIVGQNSTLSSSRKLSLNMIRRYGTTDESVYQYIGKSYTEGLNEETRNRIRVDEEEQISAVAALSALATDGTVRLLAGYLNDINTRLSRGTLTKKDERIVRVLIPALGNTGLAGARQPLQAVLNHDWTGAVQRLAQDALKKIPAR